MRTTIGLLALSSWMVATGSGVAEVSVDQLQWLAGCWSYVGREAGSGEVWSSPAGGTMLGTARVVREGETVSHEFLMIRESKDGGLEYVAHPSGQETTVFHLEKVASRRLVFANPGHDFPQRLIYHLRSDGVLAARIEGVVSGEERAIDFPMERSDCPGGRAAGPG